MTGNEAKREVLDAEVEIAIRLPQSMCHEIERLVPRDQRDASLRIAVERELLLQENSD